MYSNFTIEAEFVGVIGTKVLRVFLLAIQSHLYLRILLTSPRPHPTLSRSGLKLVCNVNIVYGNLKSENYQDYAQKSHRNSTFMNSTSGKYKETKDRLILRA